MICLVAGLMVVVVVGLPVVAQESPHLTLVHGIPDTPVDVVVDGIPLLTAFDYGESQDLSSLAGATLASLQLTETGTETSIIEAGDVALPAEGNATLVAHLDETGVPVLSSYSNDTSTVGAGRGRLVVRHTAHATILDVFVDGSLTFRNLAGQNEISADLPAATLSLALVPSGATEPILLGPLDVTLVDGEVLILYAVGSADQGSLDLLTETLSVLGTPPVGVGTGSSPVGVPGVAWAIAALAVLGGLAFRRLQVRR